MTKVLLFLSALLWAQTATAGDHPLYGPPPAWVKPVIIPQIPAPADGSAVQILLVDR